MTYSISDSTLRAMYCTFKYPRASDGTTMCGRCDRPCDGNDKCPYPAEELKRIFEDKKKKRLRDAVSIVSTACCNGNLCSEGCELFDKYLVCPMRLVEAHLKEEGLI